METHISLGFDENRFNMLFSKVKKEIPDLVTEENHHSFVIWPHISLGMVPGDLGLAFFEKLLEVFKEDKNKLKLESKGFQLFESVIYKGKDFVVVELEASVVSGFITKVESRTGVKIKRRPEFKPHLSLGVVPHGSVNLGKLESKIAFQAILPNKLLVSKNHNIENVLATHKSREAFYFA